VLVDCGLILSQSGIVLEVLGAAYLVLKSRQATLALRRFPAPLNYDNFVAALERLVGIVGGQFSDQLKGFALLVLGLALQFAGGLV